MVWEKDLLFSSRTFFFMGWLNDWRTRGAAAAIKWKAKAKWKFRRRGIYGCTTILPNAWTANWKSIVIFFRPFVFLKKGWAGVTWFSSSAYTFFHLAIQTLIAFVSSYRSLSDMAIVRKVKHVHNNRCKCAVMLRVGTSASGASASFEMNLRWTLDFILGHCCWKTTRFWSLPYKMS